MLRECRKALLPDILDAAELIGVADRTLREYEARDAAPPDIIDRMADIYQRPILRHWYCGNCVIGRKIHPEVSERDLQATVLRLKNSIRGIEDECTRLAEIADDGMIDENEKAPTEIIMSRLDQARQRITEFLVNAVMFLPNEKHGASRQASHRV